MNKKIGERISLYGMNYPGINLDDCEIYATFPDGGMNRAGRHEPRSAQ